jgi:uncharacterized protein (DUF305 family)
MTRDVLFTPTGDVDRDFAAIMIPQHQSAIDMAAAELKYGHDVELRHLADQFVAQQQHIPVLRRTTGQAVAASVPPVEW